MSTFLEELIMLADIFDAKGLRSEASALDSLIKMAGQSAQPVYDFVSDLKSSFANAAQAQDVFPTINEKSVQEIFQIIDQQLDQGSYVSQGLSASTLEMIGERTFQLATGIAELERSVAELEQKVDETADYSKKQDLITDLSSDYQKLQALYDEVETLKKGQRVGDAEMYGKFLDYYRNAKSGPGGAVRE